jgi:SAM-dependent methyltransferase
MTDELRELLLARYGSTQGRTANPSVYEDMRSPWPYYTVNYTGLIGDIPRDAHVLEIGCGHGSLLAWLRDQGFRNLAGVDASPSDVELANTRVDGEVAVVGDAVTYLEEHEASFDVVFAKAIVEHIPRAELLRLVRALSESLRPAGRAIVDVPNMDWILASHERYMDMTHESGFTRESLTTMFSLAFDDVVVTGSRLAAPTRSQRLLRPLVLRLMRRLLYIVGEGANDLLFSSRSLIAVARAPRPG